jgi:predicted esterase
MMKILCLHGKQQNKSSFRTKLGRLPSKLKNLAVLTIIDAPHNCVSAVTNDNSVSSPIGEDPNVEAIGKTWYHRNESGELDHESLNVSMNYLREVWSTDGPFDGILGFSMGGTIATLMCSEKYSSAYSGIKFVICIGAPHVSTILDDPCCISPDIKSLHIAGEADSIVHKDKSITLSNHYMNPKLLFHPLGHCIPMKAEYLVWFTSFIEEIAKDHQKCEDV